MEGLASALQRSTLDDPSAVQGPSAHGPGAALPPHTDGGSAGGGGAASSSGIDDSSGLASIHDLPDELLSRCLAEAGRQDGRPAAVSTRFRRLYLAAPALWQDITVEAGAEVAQLGVPGLSEWRDAKSALLRSTAGMARSVRLRSAGPAPGQPAAIWEHIGAAMGSLAAQLPSPALETLDIQVWQLGVGPDAIDALASLPALKHLSVGPPSQNDEAGLFDLSFLEGPLPALAQLERLKLYGRDLPPGVIASLPSLSQLSSLTISTARPLPQQLAECLPQLPQLRTLVLVEDTSTAEGMPQPDMLFVMRSITSLELGARRIQVPAIPGYSHVLSSCPHGEQQRMAALAMRKCPCCDNLSVRVHAACMPSSAPLLSLLWAAGAGAGQMNHLQLTDCHTSAAAVLAPLPPFIPEALGAAAFRRLDTLMLSKCSPVGGESLAGFLSALLPRLPALTDLELEACDLSPAAEAEGLGGALSLAPHLTSLDMNECGLAQLPTGPCLAGLEQLSVCGNSLTSVPLALATASRLSKLDLSRTPGLELSSQAETILASLPALQGLGLWQTPVDAEALARLQQRAPHLRIRTTQPLDLDNEYDA